MTEVTEHNREEDQDTRTVKEEMSMRAVTARQQQLETGGHAEVVATFDAEADNLEEALRSHPGVEQLLHGIHDRQETADAADAGLVYRRLLKMTADYVRYTVPALRASGEVLCRSDDEDDRWWGMAMLLYADEETTDQGKRGHETWAFDDMRTDGASDEDVTAPPCPAAIGYGAYFVDRAAEHPYAILGAKGVLEHLALRVANMLVAGARRAGLSGVSFAESHGELDVEHTRSGDAALARLPSRASLQVLEGAYITSGAYRSMLRQTFRA
jgi:hypothetical protein